MPNGKEFDIHNDLIDGEITVELSELMNLINYNDLCNLLSTKLTGSPLLEEMSFEEIGEIKLYVSGKFQTILENEESLEESTLKPK